MTTLHTDIYEILERMNYAINILNQKLEKQSEIIDGLFDIVSQQNEQIIILKEKIDG